MTISITDAKKLVYANFFEGLRLLHNDPLVLRKIAELQQETEQVLNAPVRKEEIWGAKLSHMAELRAGWNAEDRLVSGHLIRGAGDLLTELDKFMDTSCIEMKASPSGSLSLYWFDDRGGYQVEVLSKDLFNVERVTKSPSRTRLFHNIKMSAVLKKILDGENA